ncbi:MAG: hypothetical protein KA020_17330 [Planctomycetes bacterium]|nr:hypothetical protein [Planctomycetota bacterium]
MRPPNLWLRRLLSLCPVLIGLLWVAGISNFRGYTLDGREWAVLLAAALALHAITTMLQRRRPAPVLPEGTNPVKVSLLAAAMLAALAAIGGAVLESVADHYQPSEVALPWRATWHAACTFAATYCGFLQRLVLGPIARTKR